MTEPVTVTLDSTDRYMIECCIESFLLDRKESGNLSSSQNSRICELMYRMGFAPEQVIRVFDSCDCQIIDVAESEIIDEIKEKVF